MTPSQPLAHVEPACPPPVDGSTLHRWKMAAASFANHHRERVRFGGGVASQCHLAACAFLDGPVLDALDELASLRPRVAKLEAENAALRARGTERAVRALWERVQELEALLSALGVEEE